jgi:hypothetical protein
MKTEEKLRAARALRSFARVIETNIVIAKDVGWKAEELRELANLLASEARADIYNHKGAVS